MVRGSFQSKPHRLSIDRQKIKDGDDSGLSDLLRLFSDYTENIASRFTKQGSFNHDELVQSGRTAVLRAARSYKEGNSSFYAYVRKAIRNAIYKECRKVKLLRKKERLIGLCNKDSERGLFGFGLMTEHREFDQVDKADALPIIRQRISQWQQRLSPQQKKVIELIYYCGMNQTQAASKMGLTRSRVSQIMKEILESGKIRLADIAELN